MSDVNPLEVLEHLMVCAEDERTRMSAAKALAEYTHQKKPHAGSGADVQEVNIVMLIEEPKKTGPQLVK